MKTLAVLILFAALCAVSAYDDYEFKEFMAFEDEKPSSPPRPSPSGKLPSKRPRPSGRPPLKRLGKALIKACLFNRLKPTEGTKREETKNPKPAPKFCQIIREKCAPGKGNETKCFDIGKYCKAKIGCLGRIKEFVDHFCHEHPCEFKKKEDTDADDDEMDPKPSGKPSRRPSGRPSGCPRPHRGENDEEYDEEKGKRPCPPRPRPSGRPSGKPRPTGILPSRKGKEGTDADDEEGHPPKPSGKPSRRPSGRPSGCPRPHRGENDEEYDEEKGKRPCPPRPRPSGRPSGKPRPTGKGTGPVPKM
ncbi:Hypothetical predicted protein [Paramuricea clavata]|uniref:Uncharacterized protein n=1 Tax=Paramuricea clavata TaxID=317549 RepID=A0A7D9IH80_PARCT|nr:Hypothetical predicted protein [Paramuricea clavata]